ncbi:hypothetical protein BH11BAC3_BH11BAC3_01190 [soil metagenome]
MNILIPVLTFGRSGGNRVLSKLADELIQLGHKVDFLCPDGNEDPYFPTLAGIQWVDSKGNNSKHNNPGSHNKENAFTIQKKLKNALSKIPKANYDVIIANHSLTVIPLQRTGWTNKILYYVQAYEPDFYVSIASFKSKILSQLSAFSYNAKLFTVVNADIYLKYKKLSATRTLYPGVDRKIFYPKDKSSIQSANDKIIIGTVGRMERMKGTQYVLEAFKILKSKNSNIELHVAFGIPSDLYEYEGIHCVQPHGDEALANYYRTLDYYFCGAFIQLGAFHYPVVEAMSCGVPVITTQYYPSNDDNAWLCRPGQAADLVTGFELAQTNPVLKEKKVRQALLDVKQFDWKLVGEKLNGYLEELVEISGAANRERRN